MMDAPGNATVNASLFPFAATVTDKRRHSANNDDSDFRPAKLPTRQHVLGVKWLKSQCVGYGTRCIWHSVPQFATAKSEPRQCELCRNFMPIT